jgi:hypothetical protein
VMNAEHRHRVGSLFVRLVIGPGIDIAALGRPDGASEASSWGM